MNGVVDISLWGMMAGYGMMALVLAVVTLQRLPVKKQLLTGVIRMTVQLLAAGLVLRYLFAADSAVIVSLLFLGMSAFAAHSIYSQVKVKVDGLLRVILIAVLLGGTTVLLLFLTVIVGVEPWYDPRYLIPVGGMLLGNSMNANALAIERFVSEMRKSADTVHTYLALGATPKEASQPFIRNAVKASLMPIISNMTGMGIVFLPGMMTGQILSGTDPLVAIEYQIVIMLAIMSALTINVLICLYMGYKLFFDKYGRYTG